MCGIVGYVGKKNATTVLLNGLATLEYRGYDSAGVAFFKNSEIRIVKAKGRLDNLKARLEEMKDVTSNCGIGHTRWATHGEPSDINSHPHCGKKVALVHNGIIENYMDLKKELLAQGYMFESQTDTEVAAKLIDSCYHGDPVAAIREAIKKIRGAYAFGILFSDQPQTIYAIRKDSPLIVGLGDGENFIASDVPAILRYTRDYYLMEENELAIVTPTRVTVTDLDGNEIQKERLTAKWDVEAAEKGGYAHFMLKEIHEQPPAIRNTVTPRIKDGLPDFSQEKISDEMLSGYRRIHIVACGTAMHAGLVGKNLIEKLARVSVEVDVASEFRYRDPILSKEDLVLVISQSGETADTLAALRLAGEQGCDTMAIVNVVGSSIAREAKHVIYTWAGPEIAVASTKAYTVQVAVMYLLAIRLAFVSKTVSTERALELTRELLAIPETVAEVLKSEKTLEEISHVFTDCEDLFFIGRGVDYAVAMEGSLKLKEISYIHSEAYAAGELKHGTISLIEKDIPVIALCTQEKLMEKMISNIKEVKTRGAYVIALCPENVNLPAEVADRVISIPKAEDLMMPIATAVPLQILAYYTAVNRGCDVDKPRNLAKSVTVE